MDNNNIDLGFLKISTVSSRTQSPIQGVSISLSENGTPSQTIETLTTNSSGESDTITLATPPLEYSMEPSINLPYSKYNLSISADGYEPQVISGIEILSGQTSLQFIQLQPLSDAASPKSIVIPDNTLYGNYPPKIVESEIKPVDETGEIVLNRVVIPEYIVVHDGPPSDTSARNYYIRYKDYIKNVASSEIYSTWPESTIRANIIAIMSFTLNRVYTEWYRNRGYDFTITSSTAFDHKWIEGRNFFESISLAVDNIFNQYVSRPNVKQPILTQYCDGKRTTCPNWMSQWGSKYLGDQNYSDIEILRYYYGNDIYINSAEQIAGVPSSYPGYILSVGSSGEDVSTIQEQLNRISEIYNSIPKLTVDGIYGENTRNAVTKFQEIFDLPQTGTVGFSTWYKISDMYVRLSRIAELN